MLGQHDAFSRKMSHQNFLHLLHGAAGSVVFLHIPVVRVPTDDEPDVLGSIQLLFVRLQQRRNCFAVEMKTVLSRVSMLTRGSDIGIRSVRLSVPLSVTFRYYIETA